MSLAAEAPFWLAILFALLLVAAAIEDSARLRISNITCVLILLGAFAAAVIQGPQAGLWENIVVFGALLAIGTPLFAAGKLGGGDVKLLASSGLWFNLAGGLAMVIYVFLAGGLLALLILLVRAFGWSEDVRRRVHLLSRRGGIPYGVAIAAGALTAMALQRN